MKINIAIFLLLYAEYLRRHNVISALKTHRESKIKRNYINNLILIRKIFMGAY